MKNPSDTRQYITDLWNHLTISVTSASRVGSRKYRRLDLENEAGIRISCTPTDHMWELLVEVGDDNSDFSEMIFPNWKGMQFKFLTLPVPRTQTMHISLSVENGANTGVFATVCADMITMLEGCNSNEERRHVVNAFLFKWSRFFEKHKTDGLSPESQQGLYGELWWLCRQIKVCGNKNKVVASWKGSEGSSLDFETGGHAVEVKTTMTKEPRRVFINSEKQLDDKGFASLHLLVLTLVQKDGEETLPALVNSIRIILADTPAGYVFENLLTQSGYLDVHAELYDKAYSVVKKELFHVKEGFPRIISMPEGLGDLRYSFLLSAGKKYLVDMSEYLNFIGGMLGE